MNFVDRIEESESHIIGKNYVAKLFRGMKLMALHTVLPVGGGAVFHVPRKLS